jgi:anti-sigma-K factor RskA
MTNAEHEELRNSLGLYVLGALPRAERAEIQAHLVTCEDCATGVRSLQTSANAIALTADPVDPPARVREQLLQSIAASEDSAGRRGARSSTSSARAPWLALAASLLLAAGLGGYAAQQRGQVRALERQLNTAVLQLQSTDRQIVQARLVVADAQRQLAVLAAPDVAHVDLKGQAAAPQASARALWSRSRGLLFAASNLPAAPPGRAYQLWVISGRLAPISDGWVFNTDAAGSVTTMFSTPVTLPAPTAVAVTIEPAGGVPAPTGPMYLVGSLN